MDKNQPRPDRRVLHLIDAALDLQQAGELDHALEILQRAQGQAPDYAPLHLLMGLTYREMNKAAEAEARLRRAIELDQELLEAQQSLGLLYAAQGRPAEAVSCLQAYLVAEPDDVVTLRALAVQLYHLGQSDLAVRHLADLWHRTGSAEAGIAFGRFLIRVGEWQHAQDVLSQVAEEKRAPQTLVEWAYALVMAEEHARALEVLQEIVGQEPEYGRAWRGISGCHLNLGRPEDALEAAERALALDENHCRNWLVKANALFKLERYRDALNATQKGIVAVLPEDPESLPVLQALRRRQVKSLVELDRASEALTLLAEWAQRHPADEMYPDLAAIILDGQGREEDADQVIRKALSAGAPAGLAQARFANYHLQERPEAAWNFVEPTLAERTEQWLELLANVGVGLYVQGWPTVALAIFEQLCHFAPDQARLVSNVGFVLLGDEELDRAEECFLKALEKPDSPDWRPVTLTNLGYLYLLQGNLARAEETLQEAVSLAPEDWPAILRVACWRDGRVAPDSVPHPTRSVAIRVAARANQVTLALAQGQAGEAESLAQEMIEQVPDDPWGYTMLGWVGLAAGGFEAARRAWQDALARTADPQDQGALNRELEALAG